MNKTALLFLLLSLIFCPLTSVTAQTTQQDIMPPSIIDASYQPARPTPDDEETVTCSVMDFADYSLSWSDNFERAEIGPDWTVLTGIWIIENGEYSQSEAAYSRRTFAGDATWSNYIITLKAKKVGTVDNFLDIMFRKGADDGLTDLYVFSLRRDGSHVAFFKSDGGSDWDVGWSQIRRAEFPHSADTWHNIKIQVLGDSFKAKVWAEGASEPATWLIECTDSDYTAGKIGLMCSNHTHFDDLVVEVSSIADSGIKEVNLFYRVDDGAWNEITMSNIGGARYQAVIPKQEDEATVSFYIEALDNEGNKAESTVRSYVVSLVSAPPFPWGTVGIIIAVVVIGLIAWFVIRKGYIKVG